MIKNKKRSAIEILLLLAILGMIFLLATNNKSSKDDANLNTAEQQATQILEQGAALKEQISSRLKNSGSTAKKAAKASPALSKEEQRQKDRRDAVDAAVKNLNE